MCLISTNNFFSALRASWRFPLFGGYRVHLRGGGSLLKILICIEYWYFTGQYLGGGSSQFLGEPPPPKKKETGLQEALALLCKKNAGVYVCIRA